MKTKTPATKAPIKDSDYDTIRRAFAQAGHRTVEKMKAAGIDPRTAKLAIPAVTVPEAETETVEFRLSEPELATLALEAHREGITLNAFIVRGIRAALDREEATKEAAR